MERINGILIPTEPSETFVAVKAYLKGIAEKSAPKVDSKPEKETGKKEIKKTVKRSKK